MDRHQYVQINTCRQINKQARGQLDKRIPKPGHRETDEERDRGKQIDRAEIEMKLVLINTFSGLIAPFQLKLNPSI